MTCSVSEHFPFLPSFLPCHNNQQLLTRRLLDVTSRDFGNEASLARWEVENRNYCMVVRSWTDNSFMVLCSCVRTCVCGCVYVHHHWSRFSRGFNVWLRVQQRLSTTAHMKNTLTPSSDSYYCFGDTSLHRQTVSVLSNCPVPPTPTIPPTSS